MQIKKEFDVAICGAGPAGAALAHILVSRGIRTALIERQSDFSKEFRGEGIMPSGYKALKSIGFDLEKINIPMERNHTLSIFYQGNHLINPAPPALKEGGGLRWVSQPALLEYMINKTLKYENFEFFRGHRVKDVIFEEKRVSGLRVSNKNKELDIFARLIIGCDGRTSVLRRKLNFKIKDFKQIVDIIWFKIPYPHDFLHKGTTFANIVPNGLMICPACYGDNLQIGWLIPKGSYRELKKQGEEAWISEMQRTCPKELFDHLERSRGNISNKFVLDVGIDRCKSWSKEGVLLLGDAAHTMNPVGGQGINIALRDSIVAANHLIPILNDEPSNEDIDAAFLKIEEERLPEVKTVQNFQKRPPAIMKKQNILTTFIIKNIPNISKNSLIRKIASKSSRFIFDGVTEVKLKV